MTQPYCPYPGDRDAALIAYLYADTEQDAAAGAAFADHLASCAMCTNEMAALRGVRRQLARWSPPEPKVVNANLQSAVTNHQSPWWAAVPVWAQVAAALLFLGVAAGIANLDVKYDAAGLSVRTGWSRGPSVPALAPPAQGAAAPWRSDLTALERELRDALRVVQASAPVSVPPPPLTHAASASASDADVVRRVRALIEASEKRQQNELALRVAEVLRDVHAMRQADLVKIDRTLDAVENRVGVEVMKDRQKLNTLLVRTGSRQ
jgi:hypothetical protein